MSFPLPHQLILFGPPGTSKSYQAREDKAKKLKVDKANLVPVTFHPDFSYGEFVARLLPFTNEGRLEYRVHAGPFIRALALAYSRIEPNSTNAEKGNSVVLLIDEINRGNCAEIFGDVFQLLDREDDGWSSYEISVSELTIAALHTELSRPEVKRGELAIKVKDMLDNRKLCLPPNLFMLGTMNTSDESIFFMDSAFKRRWHFEFFPVGFDGVPTNQRDAAITSFSNLSWATFLDALNKFILEKCTSPNLDDKLVGPWFIKAKVNKIYLADHNQKDLESIKSSARLVKTWDLGAEYSADFEDALLKFADKMGKDLKKKILDFAEYDSAALRKFKLIDTNGSTTHKYYKSGKSSAVAGKLLIEDFLDKLGELQVNEEYVIDKTDIIGKLFLYLWDNVFNRDKLPLADLLGVQATNLRTFGQFVSQYESFIERVRSYGSKTSVNAP